MSQNLTSLTNKIREETDKSKSRYEQATHELENCVNESRRGLKNDLEGIQSYMNGLPRQIARSVSKAVLWTTLSSVLLSSLLMIGGSMYLSNSMKYQTQIEGLQTQVEELKSTLLSKETTIQNQVQKIASLEQDLTITEGLSFVINSNQKNRTWVKVKEASYYTRSVPVTTFPNSEGYYVELQREQD